MQEWLPWKGSGVCLQLSSGLNATSNRTVGDSSRLREVHDLVTQIGNEMKPLAKMDGMSQAYVLLYPKHTIATKRALIYGWSKLSRYMYFPFTSV